MTQIIYANDEESLVNPDTLTAQALLNCLVREVSGPEEQVWETDGHLIDPAGEVGPAAAGQDAASIGRASARG